MSVQLLAKTDLYNTLFKIGKNTYGIQGHPEIKPDLLKVWCQADWGEANEHVVKLMTGDTLEYLNKNFDKISLGGDTILNLWIDVVFGSEIGDVPEVGSREAFQQYLVDVLLPAAEINTQQYKRSLNLKLSSSKLQPQTSLLPAN
ncbi:hypothetical protein RFI_05453 [Reticulomyxa filosa]|uniref:Uncharacterized protein n=1 Tax=Reticulomyxa filosa TaxID=46433 RepID=X6NZC8_RETFI|nr:hypothetical protein RFI_05453 [Reticulomyxa filosa]|eukprot:ETO31665.1 hypothetical protein RFI_05453 [Reticulomyxa filosa]